VGGVAVQQGAPGVGPDWSSTSEDSRVLRGELAPFDHGGDGSGFVGVVAAFAEVEQGERVVEGVVDDGEEVRFELWVLGGEDEFGGSVGESAAGGVGAPSERVAEAVAVEVECSLEIWHGDLDGVDGADQRLGWCGRVRGISR
jgi:hypothetical protein